MHAAESLAPSILIADQNSLQGIDLTVLRVRFALRNDVRALVFVQGASEEYLSDLLRSGFAGFLNGGISPAMLCTAIDRVAVGEIWAPRMLVSRAFRAMVSVIEDPRFTRRELEILRRIATGQDNREIADGLCITRETVRWHLRSAYSKLGVHDRQVAVDLLLRPA
jgi:DNA-binding NarL/FixJ family response regulator